MKLQTKYSIAISTLVLALGIFLGGVQFWYNRTSLKTLATAGSGAIEEAMIAELQEKQKLLVQILATALINPVYQVDMAKIGTLLAGLRHHSDLRDVFVYDKDGRVLHDGTADQKSYGLSLRRGSTLKALQEKQVAILHAGHTLYVDAPIVLDGQELLGGISVAFSLDSINADIARRKAELHAEIDQITQRELGLVALGALVFAAAGLFFSVVLGRAWSRPIRLLSASTEKIGNGDYSVSIPVAGADEIGQLGEAFGKMVQRLKGLHDKETEHSTALQTANDQLRQSNDHLNREVFERQRTQAELVQQNERMLALHEIDSAIRSSLDQSILLNALLDKMVALLPYDAISVRLVNEESRKLEPVTARNLSPELWNDESDADRVANLKGFAQTVMELKSPLVVNDVPEDPRCAAPELFRQYGLTTYIGLPLLAENEILGVLGFYRRQPNSVAKDEAAFLATVAGQAAIGLHNARLYRDICRQKLAVEKAKEIEAAAEVKARFFAMMSHEIRTPLNAVIGATDVLLRSELTQDQRFLTESVQESGTGLLMVINDILDFSKIEADKVTVESVDFDLPNVVDGVVKIMAPQAQAKGLRLITTIAAEVPPRVVGDPGRIRQILLNLISNAIKFTVAGEIRISVNVVGNNSNGVTLKFAVQDQGVGIPRDTQERLFQPFSQADTSTTRKHGGTGLGLAISKRLAELMGGRMDFNSKVGQGSEFWFTILTRTVAPLQSAPQNQTVTPNAALPYTAKDTRILLVEDNPVNQMIALRLLDLLGLRADVAGDGVEAVKAIERQSYDLLLMDCEMPNMDGYQATAAIRLREADTGTRTRIVAMTANAMAGDREKCLEAGMDDYIAKPVRLDTLQAALVRCL